MTTKELMFELIACAVEQRAPRDEVREALRQASVVELTELYSLSRHHDMAHLVGYVLDRNDLIDRSEEIYTKFQKQLLLSILRYERLQYELERIGRLFGEQGIDFLPLKGAVLRSDYPEPWMRTSCDIDMLIHTDDLGRAEQALLEKLSYRKCAESTHDVSFFSPSEVNLELHFALNEPEYRLFDCLEVENVWASATVYDGQPHHYRMSDELFYFYHIEHTAKHFVYSGCGIRPLIDLWILDRRVEHDAEARQALLRQEGLDRFADTARALCRVWMEGAAHDELTEFVEPYILEGGVYGSMENFVAVRQARQGGRLRYAMRRIFLPYRTMKENYPCLRKHPYLLPFYHVRRWVGILFGGGVRRSLDELGANGAVSRKKVSGIEQMIDRLGVQAEPTEEIT